MKSKQLLGLSLAFAWSTVLIGQDEGAPPADVKQNAVIVEASQSGDGPPVMQFMSVSSDGGAFMGGSLELASPVMMGNDPFQMLSNPGVQNELDLVGKQLEKYKELQANYGKRITDEMEKMRKGNFSKENSVNLKAAIEEIERQKKEDLEKLLLPSQRERLQQISLQQRMRSMGTASALADDQVRESLGLSEKDVEKLRKKSQELNEKLQEKIKSLRDEMREELLKELTSDQRSRLKNMTGDQFEYKPEVSSGLMKVRSGQSESRSESSSSSSSSKK